MQVITGYIQYAFGLPPTQDAIVTNEGLGWDSLLKMEQSSWWVFTGWGVVPKHARTGWRIFFPIWLLKCLSTFWTCDASTFAPSCRLSHSSPRDNYRKLHFSSVPQQGTKKGNAPTWFALCFVHSQWQSYYVRPREVSSQQKNLKAVQTFTTFNKTPELRGDFRI